MLRALAAASFAVLSSCAATASHLRTSVGVTLGLNCVSESASSQIG